MTTKWLWNCSTISSSPRVLRSCKATRRARLGSFARMPACDRLTHARTRAIDVANLSEGWFTTSPILADVLSDAVCAQTSLFRKHTSRSTSTYPRRLWASMLPVLSNSVFDAISVQPIERAHDSACSTSLRPTLSFRASGTTYHPSRKPTGDEEAPSAYSRRRTSTKTERLAVLSGCEKHGQYSRFHE